MGGKKKGGDRFHRNGGLIASQRDFSVAPRRPNAPANNDTRANINLPTVRPTVCPTAHQTAGPHAGPNAGANTPDNRSNPGETNRNTGNSVSGAGTSGEAISTITEPAQQPHGTATRVDQVEPEVPETWDDYLSD